MPIFHDYFEQRSAEWYRLRAGIPTASQMDRIITPTGKPSAQSHKYMCRLLAEWVMGEPIIDDYESSYMIDGRDNEAAAVQAFEFQTGLETKEIGFVTADNGLVGCSPDRMVSDVGTLELKCPSAQTQVGYLLYGSPCDDYRIQVQSQLLICEREKSWVSSYHPKLPPVILEIPRDEELIGKIRAALGTFIDIMLEKRGELERKFGPFIREADITRKLARMVNQYEAPFFA